MNLSRYVSALAKNAALALAVYLIVACITLTGAGFVIAGLFLLLLRDTSPAGAAVITGAVLFALAALAGAGGGLMLAASRRRRPGLLAEFGGALGLITLLVRRDPKRAMLFAALAGALAEYFTGERK